MSLSLAVTVTAKTIQAKSRGLILKDLKTYREELNKLRVAALTQGPSRAAAVKGVRKNIARSLTIAHKKHRDIVRKSLKDSKFKPKDLRVKKTRALRRALTPSERAIKTLRQKKRAAYAESRKFAIQA